MLPFTTPRDHFGNTQSLRPSLHAKHAHLDHTSYMAAVSLSPSPIPSFPSTMSSRRVPLSLHPNGTNSPLRNHPTSAASVLNKYRQQKRAYASLQREEPYGQPPPAKKQLLNNGSKEPVRSPPAVRQVKIARPNPNRVFKDERPSQAAGSKATQQEDEAARMRRWKEATRQNFPDYVFYFESVPDEKRAKVVKQITQLGGVSLPCSEFPSYAIAWLITNMIPCSVKRSSSPRISHM